MKHARFALMMMLGLSQTLAAQSLADVAKKTEEERTAAKGTPARTYTNKDLKNGPAPGTPPSATTPALTIAADTAAAPVKAELDEEARAAEYRQIARKDEAYWKARMRDLQSTLDTDQIRLTAMESRVASLSADFNRTESAPQRVVLRREREEAATELARLKGAVLADAKAISTAEEEARRANVPPGWLRP